jgi:type II secretory pathway component PulF
MRFFTYKATDAKGQPANGTIQAATADDARLALVRAGWTVYDVQASNAQPSPPSPATPKPQSPNGFPTQANPGQIILGAPGKAAAEPQRQAQPASQVAPRTGGAAPVTASRNPSIAISNQTSPSARQSKAPYVSPAANTRPKVRTERASDKERFFLFSQLAAAFRTGLNPVTTFSEIASRSRAHFHEALEALAKASVEGGSLSRTMALYPDLFPEHVVGMTEAGQQGGFLPDGMWWTTRSLLKAWELADAQPNAGGESAAKAFWQTLVWPIGPAFLLLCFICWATYAYFGSRLAKRFRHRIGLRAPVYGKRARHENLSIFSWTLARLSHSGLPPSTAYQLSAETVPNLEMRDELRELAGRLSGAERMSQIIGNSRLFPDEYVPIIATAEYTGDLPGALQQLSDMSRNEFQTAETYAKMRSGCWGMLAFGVVGGLAMAMLMYTWYHELPAKILKDFEWFLL